MLAAVAVQPSRTEPPIREVLAQANNDRAFAAALLLATTGAVAIRLPPQYTAELREAAERKP
jgi:hypothetical protein